MDGSGPAGPGHGRAEWMEQRERIAVRAAFRRAVRRGAPRGLAAAWRCRVAAGRHRRGRGLHRVRG